MKTSTILLTFCILAVASAMRGEIRKIVLTKGKKCFEQARAAVSEKLKAGETVIADDRIKCFHACVMKSIGMIGEDGAVDVEFAKEFVPIDTPDREIILAAIDACADEKGENECERSNAIVKCIHKYQKENRAHQG